MLPNKLKSKKKTNILKAKLCLITTSVFIFTNKSYRYIKIDNFDNQKEFKKIILLT